VGGGGGGGVGWGVLGERGGGEAGEGFILVTFNVCMELNAFIRSRISVLFSGDAIALIILVADDGGLVIIWFVAYEIVAMNMI